MPKWQSAPPDLVQAFGQALASFPGAQPRKMFGYPAAFVNGNMAAGLHQSDLILRLAEPDRQALLDQPGARTFEPMPGRPMREYVAAPESVVNSPEELEAWLGRAVAYARTLPPKEPKAKKAKR